MKLNRNFAKPILKADGTPDYAPAAFSFEGRDYWHPMPEDCHDAGFVPVVDAQPTDPAPEGYHYDPLGWEPRENVKVKMENGKWVEAPDGTPFNILHSTFSITQDPPAPQPVYDRYKLVCALEEANLLLPFVQFLESDPILKIKWESAQQLDYNDNVLTDGIAALKTALGVTDEQIAAVLAASVKEGV